MKLFRKRTEATVVKQTVVVPPKFVEIPMSAEQKAMLRILAEPRIQQAATPVPNVAPNNDSHGSNLDGPISLIDGL